MTRHSQYYLKKKEALQESETELRKALAVESIKTEKSAMTLLKITGTVTVAVSLGYMLMRLARGGKPSSVLKSKPILKGRKRLMDNMSERVLSMVVKNLAERATTYLGKLSKEETTKR